MRAATLASCVWSVFLLSGCVAGLGGNIILSDADQEQALKRYHAALAQEPDSWLLRRRIGLAYFDLKQYAQAEQSLQEVQRLTPGEPVSLFYLGLSRIGKGEREAGLNLLASFRWPGKFYQQKYVQEEAERLRKHPEAPSKEVIGDILTALEAGKREQNELERDMSRGLYPRRY